MNVASSPLPFIQSSPALIHLPFLQPVRLSPTRLLNYLAAAQLSFTSPLSSAAPALS